MAQAIPAIQAITAAVGAAGAVAMALKKPKSPTMANIDDKEVKPNDEAALRNAQDMARRRKGVAATILSDGTAAPANTVASKTLLGQ